MSCTSPIEAWRERSNGRRGAGVGTPLVAYVHGELDCAGFDATLLHYLGVNPLAGPRWHRCGYRPLLTNWEVGPAWRLC